MKLPLFENFHDAYDAIVGANKNDKYNFPAGKIAKALDEQAEFFRQNKESSEMVNVHDHDECLHEEMKYCKTCDLTYCKKCSREWGTCRLTHFYTYQFPNITYPQPTTIWPYQISTTVSTVSTAWNDTITYQCNHN